MDTVLIGIGSNVTSQLGSPIQTLRFAVRAIGRRIASVRVSRPFSTPAYPPGSGPSFVNGALALECNVSADLVLSTLHEIEREAARDRRTRWAPRTLDLDLLAKGAEIRPDQDTLETWVALSPDEQIQRAPDELLLPHPRLHERSFVLVPLLDVAPDWRHPLRGKTVCEMVAERPSAERDTIKPIDDSFL